MFDVTAGQFDLVYNALSFTLASMMASTIFFWIRIGSVNEKYKSAMTITYDHPPPNCPHFTDLALSCMCLTRAWFLVQGPGHIHCRLPLHPHLQLVE
jgi:hypothetical protein